MIRVDGWRATHATCPSAGPVKDYMEIIHIAYIKQFAKFEVVPLLKTQVGQLTRVGGRTIEKPGNTTTNMKLENSKKYTGN